jgi:hypothetical protein
MPGSTLVLLFLKIQLLVTARVGWCSRKMERGFLSQFPVRLVTDPLRKEERVNNGDLLTSRKPCPICMCRVFLLGGGVSELVISKVLLYTVLRSKFEKFKNQCVFKREKPNTVLKNKIYRLHIQ